MLNVQLHFISAYSNMEQTRQVTKSLSKRSRRVRRRAMLRTLQSHDQHAFDIDQWGLVRQPEVVPIHARDPPGRPHRPKTRSYRRIFTTVRTEYNGTPLMMIGYGLHVVQEIDGDVALGFGLKTSVNIPKDFPITQYEGEIISHVQTEAIRIANPTLTSHFATPVNGGPTVNGFQRLPYADEDAICEVSESLPFLSGKPGDPIVLSFGLLKGKGGGSFANHKSLHDGDGPNAALQSDRFIGRYGMRDETALFVVATRDINAGEFIRVSYTDQFVNGSKSNIL